MACGAVVFQLNVIFAATVSVGEFSRRYLELDYLCHSKTGRWCSVFLMTNWQPYTDIIHQLLFASSIFLAVVLSAIYRVTISETISHCSLPWITHSLALSTCPVRVTNRSWCLYVGWSGVNRGTSILCLQPWLVVMLPTENTPTLSSDVSSTSRQWQVHLSDTEELGANTASSQQNTTCVWLCCTLMAVSQPQFITMSASCIVVSYFYTSVNLQKCTRLAWMRCAFVPMRECRNDTN